MTDHTDLIARLRKYEAANFSTSQIGSSLITEAATALEALSAENANLRTALQATAEAAATHLKTVTVLREALGPFADCCEYIGDDEDDEEWAKFRLLIKDYRRARAVLAEGGAT